MGIGRSVEIEPSMGISAEKSVDGIMEIMIRDTDTDSCGSGSRFGDAMAI